MPVSYCVNFSVSASCCLAQLWPTTTQRKQESLQETTALSKQQTLSKQAVALDTTDVTKQSVACFWCQTCSSHELLSSFKDPASSKFEVNHSLSILIHLLQWPTSENGNWGQLLPARSVSGTASEETSEKVLNLHLKLQKLQVPTASHMGVMTAGLQGWEYSSHSLLHPHEQRKWLYSSPRLSQLAHTPGQVLMNSTALTVGYIFQPTKVEFGLLVTQSNSFRTRSWGSRGQWKDCQTSVDSGLRDSKEINFALLEWEEA